MDLYKKLSTARASLHGTYEDSLNAENVAADILEKLDESTRAAFLESESAATAQSLRASVIGDFEKFFAEKVDDTVPESFYGGLGRAFLHWKANSSDSTITTGTEMALQMYLNFGFPDDVIGSLHHPAFQNWLFNLNVSKRDNFNRWLSGLLVDVSQELQDQRFNSVAKYVIDVMTLEEKHENEVTDSGLSLGQFLVLNKPGGQSSRLKFLSRFVELEEKIIPGDQIVEVQFGTESHTEYAGFFSSDDFYTTITIFLSDGSQYTRYQSMGKSEESINNSRVQNQKAIEAIASIYEVTNGGNSVSSSGFRTSYSLGWWF